MQQLTFSLLLLVLSAFSANGQSLYGILPYNDSEVPSEWISTFSEKNLNLDFNSNKLIILESSMSDYKKIDLSPYGTTPKSVKFENDLITVEVLDSKNPQRQIKVYFDINGTVKANISQINPNYVP